MKRIIITAALISGLISANAQSKINLKLEEAKAFKTTGIATAVIGLGLIGTTLALTKDNPEVMEGNDAAKFIILGAFIFKASIPLYVIGVVKKKRSIIKFD